MKGAASFARMDFGFERVCVKSEAVEFLDPGIIGLLEAHAFDRFMREVTLCTCGLFSKGDGCSDQKWAN